MRYLIIALLLTGCAPTTKQVKVIRTDGEATVKTIQVNNGDVLLCDRNDCKVVNP